jgi:hypothetical protein
MRLTIAEYAESRQVSIPTVNTKITELGLEPYPHPIDRRRRQLSLEQQAALDQSIPKAKPPEVVTPVVEVQQYDRPEAVGMVLAERAVTVGTITYQHQAAEDNPLFQALQNRIAQRKAQNSLVYQQLAQGQAAEADTEIAIEALRQFDIVEDAEARAAQDHHLSQQAYKLARQRLELAGAGLPPVATQPHHPTPRPTSASSPPSSVDVRSSGSTASSPFD